MMNETVDFAGLTPAEHEVMVAVREHTASVREGERLEREYRELGQKVSANQRRTSTAADALGEALKRLRETY